MLVSAILVLHIFYYNLICIAFLWFVHITITVSILSMSRQWLQESLYLSLVNGAAVTIMFVSHLSYFSSLKSLVTHWD